MTPGEWVVRRVVHVDEDARQVFFMASGMNRKEDPYNMHLCRVGFDGTGLADLTPENANHTVSFSADRSRFVDVYSRPDMPPVSVLRDGQTGKVVAELERCDVSELLAGGWVMPEVFHAKGRDGKTDIWGTIFRPANFDPNKKYPVVEDIYAGPHDSFVNKNFSAFEYYITPLVELGFIVVKIDGMGTNNRSKAFHDVCWKNLRDSGYPDRIRWIKAAARKYPYMDTSRVGVYGWSAGGQSALGSPPVLQRFLQGRRVLLRMPRQPDGQDLVERAMDGISGGRIIQPLFKCRQRPSPEGRPAHHQRRAGRQRRPGILPAGGQGADEGRQDVRAALPPGKNPQPGAEVRGVPDV